MREQEDGILYGDRSRKGKGRRPKRSLLHSDTPPSSPERDRPPTRPKPTLLSPSKPKSPSPRVRGLPDGCVDLLVQESTAETDLAAQERLKGEANLRGDAPQKVFRRLHPDLAPNARAGRVAGEDGAGQLEVTTEAPRPSKDPVEARQAVEVRVPSYAQMPSLVESDENPWH